MTCASLLALIHGFAGLASADVAAPYNGSPFLRRQSLETLPSRNADADDPRIMVQRLIPNQLNSAGAHACDMGDQAPKAKCLTVPGRGCMIVGVESRNPTLSIQAANSYCLPCELDGENIPCWNIGAWVAGKQVTDCQMSCTHQMKVRQPDYACIDTSGFISGAQCLDKGARSNSKCMFIAFEDKDGKPKSSCAPCSVEGTGGWGCPAKDSEAGEPGSRVVSCFSQCDSICPGPPACLPTLAPPPPPPPPSPGVVKVSSDANVMLGAPAPFPMPTVNPYAIAQAAADAAKAAGWAVGTLPPPKTYFPVVMYRGPGDFSFGPPTFLQKLRRRFTLFEPVAEVLA